MSARLAVLLATLALPSLAFARAEDEIVSSIRSRLDASRRNDVAAWSKFVADDMMAATDRIVRKVK